MLKYSAFAGVCLHLFYRALCSSLRIVQVRRNLIEEAWNSPTSIVAAFWHDEFFPIVYKRGELRCIAMASPSRDGDFLEAVLTRIGYEVARGSSSRKGTQALLEVVRRLQARPTVACIAIDGPRGPRHVIKHGALFLAAHAGIPIVPIRAFMEHSYVFKSWDRFQLPLPFSRVRVVYGEPYYIPSECDDDSMQAASKELQLRMEALEDEGFVMNKGEKKCQ